MSFTEAVRGAPRWNRLRITFEKVQVIGGAVRRDCEDRGDRGGREEEDGGELHYCVVGVPKKGEKIGWRNVEERL